MHPPVPFIQGLALRCGALFSCCKFVLQGMEKYHQNAEIQRHKTEMYFLGNVENKAFVPILLGFPQLYASSPIPGASFGKVAILATFFVAVLHVMLHESLEHIINRLLCFLTIRIQSVLIDRIHRVRR